VDAGYLPAAERVGRALGVAQVFRATRLLGPPRMVRSGDTVVVPEQSRVVCDGGHCPPERFFNDLSAADWQVVGTDAVSRPPSIHKARRRADWRRREIIVGQRLS